jgi:two-component system KDP operon response regulator KdpE
MPNTNNGTAGNSGNQQEDKPTICKVSKGNLEIYYQARRMILAGRNIRLTDIEFRLLWELVSHEGKAITYGELLTSVWGAEYKGETNYLHNYIRFLRAKIETDPKHPQHLVNIPRVGYRFDCLC